MAFELCTYADLKNLLGLEEATIASYPALSVIKTSVESAIEDYLGRSLESTARTETIWQGNVGTSMIGLKGLPIVSVASVNWYYGSAHETWTGNEDYYIQEYGLQLGIKIAQSKLVVVYTGGYAEGSVPENIQRAALIQTVHEFQIKDRLGSESISTEAGTVNRPAIGLLPHVQKLLNSSKHPLKWN